MAMILAGAALLGLLGEPKADAARAIRESCLEAVSDGVRTADLGGHAGTTEFTDEVISRVSDEARGLVDPVARYAWWPFARHGKRDGRRRSRRLPTPRGTPSPRRGRTGYRSSGRPPRSGLPAPGPPGTAGRRSSRRSCPRRARIRASSGIAAAGAPRWGSRRRPSARGGGEPPASLPEVLGRGRRSGRPLSGCARTSHQFAAVSGPGLSSTSSARRRACRRRAAPRRAWSRDSSRFVAIERRPTSYAMRATRAEWPRVYGSDASTASERASSASQQPTDFAAAPRLSLLLERAAAPKMPAIFQSIVDTISGSEGATLSSSESPYWTRSFRSSPARRR